MHGVYLQSLRLLAALPLEVETLEEAFDLDDVVQRRDPADPQGPRQGPRSATATVEAVSGVREDVADGPRRTASIKGLVIRTPRGIQDCSQDLDPGELTATVTSQQHSRPLLRLSPKPLSTSSPVPRCPMHAQCMRNECALHAR